MSTSSDESVTYSICPFMTKEFLSHKSICGVMYSVQWMGVKKSQIKTNEAIGVPEDV